MIIFDEATKAQVDAADPSVSTWVSANAGSGKTRVLTDRVARLLLHGTDPNKILCLTYTNAAAAEMQNRLFKRLGEWAMMPDPLLLETLQKLGEKKELLTAQKLRQARTLFASALETPGGLKIQTIHSFCDALLRQFPLEAKVSPQFKIMEDRQAKQLRADILEQLAENHAQAAFERFAELYTGFDPDSLLRAIAQYHRQFTRRPTEDDFGIRAGMTKETVADNLLKEADKDTLAAFLPILQNSDKKTDNNLATVFAQILSTQNPKAALNELIKIMLDKSRFEAKTGSMPTVAIRKANPELTNSLHDLMERVEHARDAITSINAFERAAVLYDFAKPFLETYNTYKLHHGLLDYQDLIEKSQNLLRKSSLSQWVLYRLDGGIDHVLVDEAQDTSPDQWRLIECLTEEFTSGQGAQKTERTIFVVGDEKQSIYSFQGADPKYFGEMRKWFDTRLKAIETQLYKQDLLFSFRSAEPILRLVDSTFVGDAKSGIVKDVQHRPFMPEKPGRVELWPFIEAGNAPDDQPWYEPVDRPSESDPKQQLARQISQWVETTIQSGLKIKIGDDLRPVRAGDFLILVQRRSVLFRAIIKELKARELNVAGADRLIVGDELAVKDILSLLKFVTTPEDDLSFAEALRSPLLNITEGELFTIAYKRKATLWQSFRDKQAQFSDAKTILDDILSKADWMRPYELIERILTYHNGRENLLDRLGVEAEDGIDELLSQAMNYEQTEAPTLTGFLNWFASGKVEIKREMDSTSGQIRVMTVHAAKGLEAPVVILPDTVGSGGRDGKEIIELTPALAGWRSKAGAASKAEQAILTAQKELGEQERLRLLYVALTRAESWLVICGAGRLPKSGNHWYHIVSKGMQNAGALETEDGYVLQNEQWGIEFSKTDNDIQTQAPELPDWVNTLPANPKAVEKPLSPSDLGGAKALASENADTSEENAKRRGTMIHLLLEHLPQHPQDQWQDLTSRLLQQFDRKISAGEISDISNHAERVLTNDSLKHIFAPGSLAEVAITAPISELNNKQIYGTIDRLIITEFRIIAVDYKSNKVVPDAPRNVPHGLLRQMGAYLLALKPIYPDHEIEIAILWTETQQIMSIPHDLVIDSLKSITTS